MGFWSITFFFVQHYVNLCNYILTKKILSIFFVEKCLIQQKKFKISFKNLLNEIMNFYSIPQPKWIYEVVGKSCKVTIEMKNPLLPNQNTYHQSFYWSNQQDAEQQAARDAIIYLQTLLGFEVHDINYEQSQYYEAYFIDAKKLYEQLLEEYNINKKEMEELQDKVKKYEASNNYKRKLRSMKIEEHMTE